MSILKSIALVLLAATLWLPGMAGAQENGQPEPEAGVEPQEDVSATGDAWVDAQLADIGEYGRRHREAFIDELVRYREAPRELIVELLDARDWEPGDVYFACSLARVIGRPCRFVAAQRQQSLPGSWEALATGLGAAPGSEEFGRIKRGMVRSYERWARPLTLDTELRRAFPDHGKLQARTQAPDDED